MKIEKKKPAELFRFATPIGEERRPQGYDSHRAVLLGDGSIAVETQDGTDAMGNERWRPAALATALMMAKRVVEDATTIDVVKAAFEFVLTKVHQPNLGVYQPDPLGTRKQVGPRHT